MSIWTLAAVGFVLLFVAVTVLAVVMASVTLLVVVGLTWLQTGRRPSWKEFM